MIRQKNFHDNAPDGSSLSTIKREFMYHGKFISVTDKDGKVKSMLPVSIFDFQVRRDPNK